MALANLFSSPPGEVDFDKIGTKTRSEQPHHNRKPTDSTPKNENFNRKRNKKKRKRGQPTDSTWTRNEFQNKKKFHAVSLEYEDQTVDNQKPSQHGKRTNATALSSPSDRRGVNADGGWKNESNGNGDGGNRRQHYNNNNKHRRNPNGPNIQEGQSRHGGKNVTFQEKKHLNATNKHQRNAFHQGPGAGGKKGRQQPRMQRSRPKWEERKPFMTPEFKEQNSIDVNGRLICKHFLADRCLKGEGCQFEHSRDLGGFKFHEVCKFYIQGFCMRGDSCLYMHNAFPCKFFHRGRGCQNPDSCRFSHAPLTELTERILDKFLEELKAKHQPLEPEPEPEPAADPLANTKTCEDFLANTKTLNFYSAAENSEPEPVRPFSFGANSAEFQPERPVSVLIPVPIAVTISQQPTQSADHTDSPVQSGAASASESQTPLVEQGPAEQPERPTASNSTARPSSSSSTPSASSSSSSSASKDAQNLLRATAIERPQSPRTPDPPSTPSVLRNLFSHLSPCRSDYDNDDDDDDDDDDSGNIDGKEDEMTVKMKTELEGDATSNSTDPVPLLDVTKFCTEVPREHGGAGSHSKASTPAATDHQLGLMTNPLPKSRNLVKDPQRHQHLVVPPPSKPPVPCSTPIASHLRKYRPLTVDLSPLPSLSLTAYHQTPRPHDATPGRLTSVADTQEAAPQQCVARSQGAGIKKTLTGELQGRHSLPVQSLSWANSSKCKDQKRR